MMYRDKNLPSLCHRHQPSLCDRCNNHPNLLVETLKVKGQRIEKDVVNQTVKFKIPCSSLHETQLVPIFTVQVIEI